EDWAETWAHYLHILDTLETAYYFGLSTRPPLPQHSQLTASASLDPYTHESFEDLLNENLPLTFAANCLNRSMGQPDLYPFVLVPKVRDKLGFFHQLLRLIQAHTPVATQRLSQN
ncbi:MAG: putative zinc-binding metallopeptidase, partial [Pseudomonadota bacterium]|nr:putative zinc-binding metallopeptidase [Pseudomonadota bacterium]